MRRSRKQVSLSTFSHGRLTRFGLRSFVLSYTGCTFPHILAALRDAYLRIGRIEAAMQRSHKGEIVRVPSTNLKQCPVCRGTGHDGRDRPCKACEATGEISTRSTDDIHAPATQRQSARELKVQAAPGELQRRTSSS